VLGPLDQRSGDRPRRWPRLLATYKARFPPDQQVKWGGLTTGRRSTKVTFVNGVPVVPAAKRRSCSRSCLASELALARSGAIDADLLAVAVPAVVPPCPDGGTRPTSDLIAIYMTGLATVLLLAIPFIPGLRDIPRWIPVHRLIWRDWNRRSAGPVDQPGARPEPAGQK